jgi:hypothetical protein
MTDNAQQLLENAEQHMRVRVVETWHAHQA